ncbi:MAG: GNAT family N-acetyltransferase, partial [Bacteroidia bacterium]|nr:GNAT family N-acetyltransferase [Bacteroidia bacterium]
GQNIRLRALEPEDLDFIYNIENDEEIWAIGNTRTPFSKFVLKEYLENAHKDIYEVKQLRLVICDLKDRTLGLIDLFNFDFTHKRAGTGLVIKSKDDRGKGIGKEALGLLVNYCFEQLNLHQLYCNIGADNEASLRLFKSVGFEEIGVKKDWNLVRGQYQDEILLQYINQDEH